MPRLSAVATAVPDHVLTQTEARSYAEAILGAEHPHLKRLVPVFDNAGVARRHLARPVPWYLENPGWKERNDAFLDVGLELLERATRDALARANLVPGDVDGIVLACSTGLATPSLEARLMNRMGLRPDLLRVPVWGWGCAGGVNGLARTMDLATAHPRKRFLMLSLELCSLAFLRTQLDKKMVVAAALFGDGCAAAVVEGDEVADDASPRWRGASSFVWPDTEHLMGWDVLDEGLGVVFDVTIPQFVAAHMREPMEAFMGAERPDAYAFHPGGSKVVEAFQASLGLPPEAFWASRDVLREYGNMSSPTVLFVLERLLQRDPNAGRVLLGALGPGFASELAMIETA